MYPFISILFEVAPRCNSTHFHLRINLSMTPHDSKWCLFILAETQKPPIHESLVVCVMLSRLLGEENVKCNSVQYLFQLVTEKVNWVFEFNEVWNFGKIYLFFWGFLFYVLCRKNYIHELIELLKMLRFYKQTVQTTAYLFRISNLPVSNCTK